MNPAANKVASKNAKVLEDQGPRLSYNYGFYCVGRDRAKRMAIKGGLGAMGVGQRWTEERFCEDYPGFKDAPEVEYNRERDEFPFGTQGTQKTPCSLS